MTILPFTNPVASPAVSAPSLKISPQQESGSALGGLAGVAGDLLGGGAATDPWNTHLLSLRMDLAMGDHVDSAVLYLLEAESTPATSLGDVLEISLGPDAESETLIYTGAVERVETALSGYRRVTLASPLLALAQSRLNGSYQEQSASDIVRSLLAETEVTAGNIDSGELYPFYAVSDKRTLLFHIHEICRQQNWLFYASGDGGLNAHALAAGDANKTFAYGVDIIELQHWQRLPSLTGSKVIGGGAATSQGKDAWSWLTKEPRVLTESGDGRPVFARQALRDVPGTQAYAGYLSAQDQANSHRVRLRTIAAPEVLTGSAFGISGAPHSAANGTFVADRVVISFDRTDGYISLIEGFNRDAAGSSALGALGDLL